MTTHTLSTNISRGTAALFLMLSATLAANAEAQGPCQSSATNLFTSCRRGATSDYYLARARCFNLPTTSARIACIEDALEALDEGEDLCEDQREARLEVCSDLGSGFYAPTINPANFVALIDNPYLPFLPGTTLTYEKHASGKLERDVVHVSTRTKTILGVRCQVIEDTVTIDGHLHERTLDYFAQDVWGNVWYFGELSLDFENDELVGLAGSWLAGVDGAQPGIVMKATPHVGDFYRQEYLIGEAEDLGEVLSLNASASVPFGSFTGCVKTEDTTPIEPDTALENKFYVAGIGKVLSINLVTGTRTELVSVTHD